MRKRVLPYLLLGVFLFMGAQSFLPLVNRSPHNARRASCQSNLKQIGLAVAQYAQDYDEILPLRPWVVSLLPYTKSEQIFQCPEASATQGTTDYFWNRRFIGARQSTLNKPKTLILLGDGQDDAPLDVTLSSLPEAWRREENSPSHRHLSGANYGFADGHVKFLRPERVTRDFRTGQFK
jgi:prepilin-type processing-associated H-X9-DG protein